jgi:hypothetical protein
MPQLEAMDGRDVLRELSDWQGDALLVLGTAACGACRRARQVLQSLSIEQLGGPSLKVVEVDALHAMGLIHDWEIDHLPGLVLVRDGEAWSMVSTPLRAEPLAAAVRAARRGPADPNL